MRFLKWLGMVEQQTATTITDSTHGSVLQQMDEITDDIENQIREKMLYL